MSSGCRLGLDLRRHLLGAVVGQAQAHDGQHHGDLVDSAVPWLRLHLAGDLPLQGVRKQWGKDGGGQLSVETVRHSKSVCCHDAKARPLGPQDGCLQVV